MEVAWSFTFITHPNDCFALGSRKSCTFLVSQERKAPNAITSPWTTYKAPVKYMPNADEQALICGTMIMSDLEVSWKKYTNRSCEVVAMCQVPKTAIDVQDFRGLSRPFISIEVAEEKKVLFAITWLLPECQIREKGSNRIAQRKQPFVIMYYMHALWLVIEYWKYSFRLVLVGFTSFLPSQYSSPAHPCTRHDTI